jgi:hypothetical protein
MPLPLIIIPGTMLDIESDAAVQSVPDANVIVDIVVVAFVVPLTALTYSGFPVCVVPAFAAATSVIVVPEALETVSPVGMPLVDELPTPMYIPDAIPDVLETLETVVVLCQVPVSGVPAPLAAMVSVAGAMVAISELASATLVGPTTRLAAVSVKVAFEEIVIEVPLTLLTVAPDGIPGP